MYFGCNIFSIYCVTLRGSARGSYLEALPQQGQICSNMRKICPQLIQKASNPPKFLPTPPQKSPKTFQKQPKSHPKGLLELILDQCFKRIWFWTPKKWPKCVQKWPKDAPERPKPLPNGAQDPSKSTFQAILCSFFSHLKIALIFHWFLIDLCVFFKRSTLTKHRKNLGFFDVFAKSQF